MPDATVLRLVTEPPTPAELALEDFLGFYDGNTRAAYGIDLAILFGWCITHGIDPLGVTRLQLEQFVRHLEQERGNSIVTIRRRMSVVRCFYRIAAADHHIPVSPAEHVRLPRAYTPDFPDNGLDRFEIAAMMRVARAGWHAEPALIALMAWLGLRVTEACMLVVPDMLHVENGHRVLKFIGKGRKPARLPMPIPVHRILEQTVGDRQAGPILLRRNGEPYNRRAAARVIVRTARRAGIERDVSPHWLRHAFVSNALEAGIPIEDVSQAARHADTRMTQRYDRRKRSLDKHAAYSLSTYYAGAGI